MITFLKKIFFSLSWQVFVILLCGLILSVSAVILTLEEQSDEWAEQLRQEALEDTLILVGKLEVAEGEVMGILAMFRSMGTVSQNGFKTYVTPILSRSKFIEKFEWAPRISQEMISLFTMRARRAGSEDLKILEKNPDGQWETSAHQDEYFPVHFSVSKQTEPVLYGRDLNSIPQWKTAMTNARDLGGLTSDAELIDKAEETLIHLFAPHFDSDSVPKDIEERRKSFQGVVYGVYRMNNMMNEMVLPYLAKGMNLAVVQGNEVDQNKIFYGSLWEDAELEIKIPVVFANKRWLLIWQANKKFLGGPDRSQAYWYGGTLFGATCFIVTIFQILATRTRQVENLVEVRTDELMRSNQELKQEVFARKRAEADLVAARDGAEAANRAKSSFLANMSHEIRTPMNAILGYAQLLLTAGSEPGKVKSYVTYILKSGDHLLQIINDILDLSKIEAGKMELNIHSFDLNRLLDDVETIILPKARKKNLEWHKEGIKGESCFVVGDETKLKQTLINLLDNAVKFTESGKVSVRVEVVEDNHYRFEVMDTGRGIEKSFLNKIFQPFQQESGPSHKGGTGLGLSIAQKQTILMGGKLLCESSPGQGTRFIFTLPLASASEDESFVTMGEEILLKAVDSDSVEILVVDDDAMSRDVLEKILQTSGACVASAKDGFFALEYLEKHSPQIIFMDMRMPGMSGLETIGKIREKFPVLSAKFIGISASALDNERLYYLDNGCDAFISKPFRAHEILSCARRLLGIQRKFLKKQESHEAPTSICCDDFPKGFFEKIIHSAELHNITELKQLCVELGEYGESGSGLKRLLTPLIAHYDMKKIVTIIQDLHNQSEKL
jgi:signal transduction histidine kinase/CheY-like chemotaxis protein